jgi:DNA-binding Xre family transcriptional regulator
LAKATVDRIANNSITMYDQDTVLKLCEYLECTPGELLVIEEIDDPQMKAPRLTSLAATAIVGM